MDQSFVIKPLKEFLNGIDGLSNEDNIRTEFYNMIFVTSGEITYEIDFLEYKVQTGEMLLISNNRMRKYLKSHNVDGFLIRFTEGYLCDHLSSSTTAVKDLFTQSYLTPHLNVLDAYNLVISKSNGKWH